MPTTTEEAWRFTDLRGFDPDSFALDAQPAGSTEGLLELDVAGIAVITEAGIEIERAPEGIRFEPLYAGRPAALHARRLEREVRRAQRGGLEARPARPGPEGRRARQAALRADRELGRGERAHLAPPRRRRGGLALQPDRGVLVGAPDSPRYSNAVAELFVGQAAKLEYVSIQNLSQETWHFATHHARVERDAQLDWVAGGFGSKKGKIRIQNDLSGPGATSRVTGAYFADGDQHLDYDTFQEHMAPSTESDFAFKGALREQAHAVWRGMIRVEEDAQKTNAYQENRNLLLSDSAHADSIPGLEIMANDVRCTHGATIGRVDRERAVLPDDPRALASRGRAADRSRVLPGHPRPDRPRTGQGCARRRPRGAHPAGALASLKDRMLPAGRPSSRGSMPPEQGKRSDEYQR